MSAIQTLTTATQNTDRLNGHGFAPEMGTNNHVQTKRNGRKPQKDANDKAQSPSSSDTSPTSVTPDTASIPTTERSVLPPTSTATAMPPTMPAVIAEAVSQTAEPSQSDADVLAPEMVPEQSEQPAATVSLTPVVIAQSAHEANVRFFQDQHGNVFAWVPVHAGGEEHFECLGIKSRTFLARLLELIKGRTALMPQLSTLKQAIEILQLEAYRAPKEKLDNRRSAVDDDVFIDLGDENWSMIHVNRDGWQVTRQDEPRFFRPQHMKSLPEPQPDGNLDDLFTYVPTENDGDKLLLIAWLLEGMYARIPDPILLIVGQQGSAKTTRSLRLRSLLDPSSTPVLGDLEMSNMFLTFQHHAVPCFENVSHFNRREADMFCRAVTGNGVERRKLYTDGDQVLYSFRRPIIINGIDTPSTRHDFLDRCVIYNCKRMDEFIPLEELDRQFEAARPRLFGAMLDLLVKTLKVLNTTPPATKFRMADFARFGRAVAVALGKKPEDFDDAYQMNIQQQSFEVLEDAPMGRVLEKFATQYASKKPWAGTAEQLLARLREVAHVAGDQDGKSDLPKSARWLSSRLGELAPAMASRQVFIRKLPRTNAARLWEVSTPVKPDPNAEPDDILAVLEELKDEVQEQTAKSML